ncbi:TonB-dependent receptor plug domain-containing protein [Flavobacterium ajazii]|uniref:TonB-dependent receptor plug domain-containing protein n=1 Tax=Flavobacterium ajazii TaxID=2692318 RepID=UPI0013D73A80|nr:TonB-dependent receptor plug domain-containing protein [Flavobacterium ajazii]
MRNKYTFLIMLILMTLPSFSQENQTKEKEKSTEKNKEKDSEAETLENITVQGTSKKKKLETSGFAVSIIETKEASLRNLTTNELLDRSVGVRVRQNGGIGSNVVYNLNGMSGSTIGVFLNGIEVSTYGQSFNLNNIPPAMIERIEVYKGVLPAHLTGDYVGGAINVILKKDVSQNTANVSASYGSFNTFQSDFGVMYRDKKTGFSFRGTGSYIYTDNSYETWGYSSTYVNEFQQIKHYYRAKRFNNTYKNISGRFEVGFTNTKWADQFFIVYNGSSNYTEIPHGITMSVPYVGRFNETGANVFELNYNKRNFLAKNLTFNVNAVRSERNTYLQDTVGYAYNWDGKIRHVYENGVLVKLKTKEGGQQGKKVITDIDTKITNARANLGYLITDGHRVSLNHKFEATNRKEEDLLNPASKDLATDSHIYKNIISMSYDAETFNRKLKTYISGKYTNNRVNDLRKKIVTIEGVNSIVEENVTTIDSNFGFGGTVSYNVIPSMFITGSTENSYIMPSDMQLFGAPEQNILPNLQLQAEKYINYNLGFRWNPSDFGKHKIAFYVNAFWRNAYNKITAQTVNSADIVNESDANPQTTQYVNLEKTQAKGFEAEIIYIYNNRLNTSFNISKFNNLDKSEIDSDGNKNDYYGHQVANEPFFTMNANMQYNFLNVFQKESLLTTYYNAGYVAEYFTARGMAESSKTPTQISHDLGLSYRFPSKKLVASVDLKNMFNAQVYDNFQIQKPGRGIYFKLNYTFSKF